MNTPWSCYLDATIKCTGVHEGQLLSLIGHDGSEIIAPNLPEPFCRRGFNPFEVMVAMLNFNWLMATFPSTIDHQDTPVLQTKVSNLRALLKKTNKPVIWCSDIHAVGYLPEELGTLPVQDPLYVTILTKLSLNY